MRKINGKAIVKRNIKEYSLELERYQKKREDFEFLIKVPSAFSSELVLAHKAAHVYPDKFNRDQMMVQKSLKTPGLEDIKIDEADESAEQSEKETNKVKVEEVKLPENKPERLSVHVGSVEEFLGSRVLFEQGQMQVSDYNFFVNIYFRQFKLDHIRDCKLVLKLIDGL